VTEAEPIVIQRDMTAAVFFTLQPSRQPQNLIDGLVYIAPAPGEEHEEAEFHLAAALREFAREHGGRVLVRPYACELSETTVAVPDLAYVTGERTHLAGSYLRGAPDLAIEVVSRGTRAFDTEAKFTAYGKGGVREAWFVDLETRTTNVVNGDGSAWQRERAVPFGEPIPSETVDVGDGGLGQFSTPSGEAS
jgi:Uma2 family endonuclease